MSTRRCAPIVGAIIGLMLPAALLAGEAQGKEPKAGDRTPSVVRKANMEKTLLIGPISLSTLYGKRGNPANRLSSAFKVKDSEKEGIERGLLKTFEESSIYILQHRERTKEGRWILDGMPRFLLEGTASHVLEGFNGMRLHSAEFVCTSTLIQPRRKAGLIVTFKLDIPDKAAEKTVPPRRVDIGSYAFSVPLEYDADGRLRFEQNGPAEAAEERR